MFYYYLLALGSSLISTILYTQFERRRLDKKYYSLLKKYKDNAKDENEQRIILDLIDEYDEYFDK